ncbi:glycosyltransferase [uncultured Winogradskyella sp.]|uniref:glycosyltransferase n=1 Tax=uncultured Winogradskyella sp. TaxID=395353 RepID=UPI00260D9F8A|nr:glycosyltransferase [uncultured Winogradskyella sp.]
MENKIKIFFVLPTLFAGGAERVMSFVSQNLDKEKFDVTLVVIGLEKESKFPVSGIPVIYLNKTRVMRGVFALSSLIRKQKPQIVVSSISHLNATMGLISIVLPKVIFVGRHASILNKVHASKKSFFQSIFDYFSYGTRKLDHFICQSEDMKQSIINVHNIDSESISIINNPITQTDVIKTNINKTGIKKFITVGRLSKTKGQMRILEVLRQLTIPFHYTIIGDGPLYNDIVNRIKEYGLEDKVTLIKFTDQVFNYLIEHDIFLQGSYSEGFPNALLESCVVGVPAIAFNSPGGTREIVEDGINGYLVENHEEFVKRLSENRDWDPEIIRESVYKKFNKNKIIADYENLFKEILRKSS